MPPNHFQSLGLVPAAYSTDEIERAFQRRRAQLLEELHDAQTHRSSRTELDAAHLAFRVLRDPRRQAVHLADLSEPAGDRVEKLRSLIQACIEDGVLRHSRRRELLNWGRVCGLSAFDTQLLIAQVLYGETRIEVTPARAEAPSDTAAWRPLAVAGALATVMFVGLATWLGL